MIPVEQHARDAYIAGMVATDPEAARAACLRVVPSSGYVPRLGIAALCEHYAASAPQDGVAFIRALDPGSEAAEEATISLATSWASSDFDAVLGWMAGWETDLRDQTLATLAAAQPVRCVQVWNLFSDKAIENEGNFYAIADAFAVHGAAGAANQLIQLPEEERRCLLWEVFRRVADSSAGLDPLRTELSRPWPPDILSGMATALGFRLENPREAGDLLIKHGASESYPLRSVAETLATVDLTAALNLLVSQPEELADRCYYDTWTHGAAPDPAAALRIALSRTEKRLRSRGCQTVLRQWAWQAPQAAAEAWSALNRDHRDTLTDDEWAEGAAYIAEQWARRSPEATVAWAEALSHEPSRAAALKLAAETEESQPGLNQLPHPIPPFKPPLEPPPILE